MKKAPLKIQTIESLDKNYSVLMSVYAKEKPEYLQESIQSMLNQTVASDDFILVCDGLLTDELYKVIKKFSNINSFNVIQLPENKGLGEALNIGLKHCKHELVARMDSDDIAYPDRCEKQIRVFCERQVDIVSGTVEEFENGQTLYKKCLPENPTEIYLSAAKRNPFNHPCVMYRKSCVLNVNGYQGFDKFEDYHLWIRMLDEGALGYNIPSPILKMRTNNDLYHRRGGFQYVQNMLHFRWDLKKRNKISLFQFLYQSLLHAGIAMLPTCVRKKIYRAFLRKKIN